MFMLFDNLFLSFVRFVVIMHACFDFYIDLSVLILLSACLSLSVCVTTDSLSVFVAFGGGPTYM